MPSRPIPTPCLSVVLSVRSGCQISPTHARTQEQVQSSTASAVVRAQPRMAVWVEVFIHPHTADRSRLLSQALDNNGDPRDCGWRRGNLGDHCHCASECGCSYIFRIERILWRNLRFPWSGRHRVHLRGSRPVSFSHHECSLLLSSLHAIIGTTRDNFHGRPVLRLEYEAYEPMALLEMRKICADMRTQWAVERVAMLHRIGCVTAVSQLEMPRSTFLTK